MTNANLSKIFFLSNDTYMFEWNNPNDIDIGRKWLYKSILVTEIKHMFSTELMINVWAVLARYHCVQRTYTFQTILEIVRLVFFNPKCTKFVITKRVRVCVSVYPKLFKQCNWMLRLMLNSKLIKLTETVQ